MFPNHVLSQDATETDEPNVAVAANSVSAEHITISEFRTRGPNGDTDDMIELFNPTPENVAVGGWQLKVSTGTEDAAEVFTIPDDVILSPGQYFLATSQDTSITIAPDISFTLDIPDNGGLALLDGENVVDQVGMSIGGEYFEGMPLLPMTGAEDSSYERLSVAEAGNCSDTDDNAADFTRVNPSNPQNMSSPMKVCLSLSEPTNTPVPTSDTVSIQKPDATATDVDFETPTTAPDATATEEAEGVMPQLPNATATEMPSPIPTESAAESDTFQADANGNISHPNPGLTTFTWTAEALSNAQPMPLRMLAGKPDTTSTFNWGGHTRQWSNPYTGPGPNPGFGPNPGPETQHNPAENGYEYPPPYSRYTEFSNVNRFPLRTIGALFFTQNGSSYRCSGAVAYRNIVWTAGHCVHDGGGSAAGWSSNFQFCPSWRAGAANPRFGCYTNWSNAWVRTEWYNNEELGMDFAVIVFDSSDYPGDDVGWLGFETGRNPVNHWAVIGFPSQSPFNGRSMITCQAPYSSMDASTNPDTVGFGCDMTGGSSGGPGIRKISGRGGYINTNMSYGYIGFGQEAFGPYLGDQAWGLYCIAIQNGTGVTNPDC